MTDYQRGEAIEFLCIITDVDPVVIEDYNDAGLETWLGELGYEWRTGRGTFGAWVPINPPPVFAPVALHIESDGDNGPLFQEVSL